MEAFATQAAHKERFIRTILQTHFVWHFGRELRCEADERGLYSASGRLWQRTSTTLRPLIKALVLTPEYLNGTVQGPPAAKDEKKRLAKLATLHAHK